MTQDNRLLYGLRGQQLQALHKIIGFLPLLDGDAVARFTKAAGQNFDASRLTDKDLEQIDVLAGRYFQ